jgi:hypothetical protein
MPMSKEHKAANKKRRDKLVRGVKKANKAVIRAASAAATLPSRIGKAGICVAKGMKRGLSLADASEACGITKRKSKPLKIKKAKRKARMTSDIKKVSPKYKRS